MQQTITLSLSLVIFCGASFYVLTLLRSKLQKKSIAPLLAEQKTVSEQLVAIEQAVTQGFDHVLPMVSLAEIEQLREEVSKSETAIEVVKQQLGEAKLQVSEAQNKIQAQESELDKVKAHTEQSGEAVSSLLARNELLSAEGRELAAKLGQYKSQLGGIEGELTLNAEQSQMILEIISALEKTETELAGVSQVHDQTRDRVTSLNKQHEDLNAEYKRLLESAGQTS